MTTVTFSEGNTLHTKVVITDGKQSHEDFWPDNHTDMMGDWAINVLVAYYNIKFSDAERMVREAWGEFTHPVGENNSDD